MGDRPGTAAETAKNARNHDVVLSYLVSEYEFELYVAGDGIRSRAAIETLTAMCEERLAGRYVLVVVDVLADPEHAESAKILATPTLLRRKPSPSVRIIGDLTLTASVLAKLGVPEVAMLPEIDVRKES